MKPSRVLTALTLLFVLGCKPDSSEPPDRRGAWFTDVAQEAGIDFLHDNGARGDYQVPEIMGSGCAWIDYDLDGDLDAYLVSAGYDAEGARNRLFRNESPGGASGERTAAVRFTDVSKASGADDGGFGMGSAVGDFDGDGYPDIYVTNFGPNSLYRNRGDGTFADVTAAAGVADPRWGASAAFVDIDRDGDLDLFVVNYMKHPRRSAEPCHDAAGRIEYCGPNSHFPPERDTLYRNHGDGTFRDVTLEAGMAASYGNGLGVVCADFNRDGHTDIFVANDATPNQLWINGGDGRFDDRAVVWGAAYNQLGQAEAGMGVQAEDVDGDGWLDILLCHLVNETNTLYRGGEHGHFEDISFRTGLADASRGRTGFGMAFLDADHDGDLDLVVANGRIRRGPRSGDVDLPEPWDLYAETDQFFEHLEPQATGSVPPRADGPGGFRFVERSEAAGEVFRRPHVGRGLAVGDYDADGDVDVLVTACAGRARLLRNDAPKRGRWLMVRVLRRGGKGYAYGARVAVRAAGRLWVRQVQPAYSYFSSNDPRLHFGLGEVESAAISVEWPDGTSTELENVPVDRLITVEQGKRS